MKRIAPILRRPGSAQLVGHLEGQGIECNLRVRSSGRNDRNVVCEFDAVNSSLVSVTCRLYGIDGDADTREYGTLSVPSRDVAQAFLLLPYANVASGRVYLEVNGDGVNLSTETVLLSERAPAPWPTMAIAALFFMSAISASAIYSVLKPTVAVLGIPAVTSAGALRAGYVIGGAADGSYRVSLLNGVVVAAERLTGRRGEVTIRLPEQIAGNVVRVAFVASGPIGRAEDVESVTVRPSTEPRAERPAQ